MKMLKLAKCALVVFFFKKKKSTSAALITLSVRWIWEEEVASSSAVDFTF